MKTNMPLALIVILAVCNAAGAQTLDKAKLDRFFDRLDEKHNAMGSLVIVKDGQIIMEMGVMTGVTWTNPVVRMNYEISLEAMRVEGSDFFCALTFPVGDDPCSLIVGGWGGGVVGLSSLDSNDASSNETTQYINFQTGKWYLIQLRVTPNRIQVWLDSDPLIDVDITGKKISISSEVDESVPLGVATWATTGALRNFKLRKL